MRDILIIVGMIIVAMCVGAWLLFSGGRIPRADGTEQTGAVAFSILAQGPHAAAVQVRTNYRIQDADHLNALWSLIYDGQQKQPPAVDFDNNEVIAVFDGSHTTGGYDIAVEEVTDSNNTRMVRIRHSVPGSSCGKAETLTAPFEVVLVPKTELALSHQDDVATSTCP